MSREENSTDPLQLTVDMVRRRDDLRTLLGEHVYACQTAVARSVIRGVATERGVDLMNAALQISQQMNLDGHNPSIVIAALVDELQGVAA